MASYDLVVRNGTVVDGTGLPGYRADVGINDGRIAHVGRIRDPRPRSIDADGQVVSPGFVDGHTHMDAQVCWDGLGSSSCWHGVTTVVMGNCGLTLAPMHPDQRQLMIRNLEGVEDIPGDALNVGVPWSWTHYRDYLDHVEAIPKGINYAGYVGHSALRTWAMGERAFEEAAGDDDLAAMAVELRDALAAGAVGFTTSRADTHMTSDGRPVMSRAASWAEVVALVDVMADAGGGIFELANESVISSPDPEARGEYVRRLFDLAVSSGVPMTFGVTGFGGPDRSRALLALIDDVGDAGGRMFGQCLPMGMAALYSFKTRLPFEEAPAWREVRRLPLGEQAQLLRHAGERKRLVAAAAEWYATAPDGYSKPRYDDMVVLREPAGENPTLGQLAQDWGVDPADVVIELSLESDFNQFFSSVQANADPDEVRTIAEHPRTVMTFTDSGAHVGQFIFTSMHTHVLADWVREREILSLEEAVRELSLVPATAWGFADRGLVREGFVADLNVFDPEDVAPELPEAVTDLPGGAVRLIQRARGFGAIVVGGEPLFIAGEHTGAFPGRLLRRARPAG